MGSWVDEISDEEIEQLWENPPDNSVPLDSATIVYFDQKAWGDLLTGYRNEDSEYSQAYETIKDSTQDQDFIYPFSFSNIIETGVHGDEDSGWLSRYSQSAVSCSHPWSSFRTNIRKRVSIS